MIFATRIAVAGACALSLVSCVDGVREATQLSSGFEYEQTFQQIPLVDAAKAENRTLTMFVVTGANPDGSKLGYRVRFPAARAAD
ncbi:MAG: hypothetical protein AAF763_05245 [Pseudomonadota bacterium]